MNDDKTLRTSRILPFSPKEKYGAFESPALLARWWGPGGFTSTFDVFEFSEGGRWRFTMHGPDGKDYFNESVFEELVPDARIVIHHDCPPDFRLTVELAPVSEGTCLTWTQVFDDARTAQAVSKRVGSANEENIDRLAHVLGSSAGPT